MWTIVRPVSLTDDPGTGRVRVTTDPVKGEVSRDDVAGVLAAVLATPGVARTILYVTAGDDPIDDAVAAVTPGRAGESPR
jgi:uncharacterized protein YbjT (DUF2867 family)